MLHHINKFIWQYALAHKFICAVPCAKNVFFFVHLGTQIYLGGTLCQKCFFGTLHYKKLKIQQKKQQ